MIFGLGVFLSCSFNDKNILGAKWSNEIFYLNSGKRMGWRRQY